MKLKAKSIPRDPRIQVLFLFDVVFLGQRPHCKECLTPECMHWKFGHQTQIHVLLTVRDRNFVK